MFAKYPGQKTFAGVSYLIHGLTGEAGEIANQYKKAMRDDQALETAQLANSRRAALLDELGDTLWYLTQLATELGCPLSEIVRENRRKLESRNSATLPAGYGG